MLQGKTIGEHMMLSNANRNLHNQFEWADKLITYITWCLALGFAFFLAGLFLFGCHPQYVYLDDPKVVAYKTDLLDCVDHAKTIQESKECRAHVEAIYAKYKDAGAND